MSSVEIEVAGPDFDTEIEIEADQLAAAQVVRTYAWNTARGVDASGAVELARETAEPAARRRRPRRAVPPTGDPTTAGTAGRR
jgi:hypothetical protein